MTTTVAPARDDGPDTRHDEEVLAAERAWRLAAMIAGRPRVRLGVRTGRPGEFRYPQRAERPLTSALPNAPAAVCLVDKHGCIRTLCLDLDVGDHGRLQVQADLRTLTAWLGSFGARCVTDRSPSGGHHIYVPLAAPVPYRDASEVVRALKSIAPTLDASIYNSVHGCIRAPGARWKHGGYQELLDDLDEAATILGSRNSEALWPQIWAELEEERRRLPADEPASADERPGVEDDPTETTTTAGALFARLETIARDGSTDGYKSRSEARMAVLVGAVRVGMRFTDVVARVEDGRWPGLASFYAKYTGGVARRRLSAEWNKAGRFVASAPLNRRQEGRGNHRARISYTSHAQSHAPTTQRRSRRESALHWLAATDRQIQAYASSTRQARSARWVARSLAEAALKSDSTEIAFGVRSLAVAAGMSHTSVATHLRWLRSLPDPPVVLDQVGRLERADTYRLVIPADLVTTRPPRGRRRVFALRPAFRSLGHVAAEVFEAVEDQRADSALSAASQCRMSLAAATEAVQTLLSYGLLVRVAGQLQARPGRLPAVAEYLGAHLDVAEQVQIYRLQRHTWHEYLARLIVRPPRSGRVRTACQHVAADSSSPESRFPQHRPHCGAVHSRAAPERRGSARSTYDSNRPVRARGHYIGEGSLSQRLHAEQRGHGDVIE